MYSADTLATLFRHNTWANECLIELCAGLSDDQLDATLLGAFGSIRDTLEHIVTAERSYLSRISTGRPYRHPVTAPPLSLAEMLEWARASGDGLVQWAPQVQPSDVVEIDWDGVLRDVPKTILLTQAINHATEHRAQVMTILTQLGIEPPELDSWAYFDAMTQTAEASTV